MMNYKFVEVIFIIFLKLNSSSISHGSVTGFYKGIHAYLKQKGIILSKNLLSS